VMQSAAPAPLPGDSLFPVDVDAEMAVLAAADALAAGERISLSSFDIADGGIPMGIPPLPPMARGFEFAQPASMAYRAAAGLPGGLSSLHQGLGMGGNNGLPPVPSPPPGSHRARASSSRREGSRSASKRGASKPADSAHHKRAPQLSDEAQVSWAQMPLESLPFNAVFALHSYLDTGAVPVTPTVALTAPSSTAAGKDSASGVAPAPLSDTELLLLDHGQAPLPSFDAEGIVGRVGASFSQSTGFVPEQASLHTSANVQLFASVALRRGEVVHASLEALRCLQAKIFAQMQPAVDGPAKARSEGKAATTPSGASTRASLFSLATVPPPRLGVPSSLLYSSSASGSGTSPTLRMLVQSFFPLLSSVAARDAQLKPAVLASLLNVMSTLPPLGLQVEPDDCLVQFRALVQQETRTRPTLGLLSGAAKDEFAQQRLSGDADVAAAAQGMALSTLLALAIQRGRLHPILEAIAACLQAVPQTQAAIATLREQSGEPQANSNGSNGSNAKASAPSSLSPSPLVARDVRMSVDVFLSQLQSYRAHECVPQLSNSAFVTAWQHHSACMAVKPPHKTTVELPIARSDAAAATSIAQRAASGESSVSGTSASAFVGSVASDGTFLYLFSPQGLLKVGSGYGGSVAAHVYAANSTFGQLTVQPTDTAASKTAPGIKAATSGPAQSKASGLRSDEHDGALVFVQQRLFFARPNYAALASTAPKGSRSKARLQGSLLREIDPITLCELTDIEVIYKPARSSQQVSAVTGSQEQRQGPDSAVAESKRPKKAPQLPFYHAITSDGEFLYGLHCSLLSSSSKQKRDAGSVARANTPGAADRVDVFLVSERTAQFVRTIELENTDGRGSQWEGADRLLLPAGMTPAALGLRSLSIGGSGVAAAAASSSWSDGSGLPSSNNFVLLPYKCAAIGGSPLTPSGVADGYFLRMPSLPRLSSTTPPLSSFKPDVFSLQSGKCLSRGGWEPRTYDSPWSTLQASQCALASGFVPTPRGTALTYDAANDLIIDYSPLTMQLLFFANTGTIKSARTEGYEQRRVRHSQLAEQCVLAEGSLAAEAAATGRPVLSVVAAVLQHVSRLASTHDPTPAQMSLAGVSSAKHIAPLSPFSNQGVPSSSVAHADGHSAGLTLSSGSGSNAGDNGTSGVLPGVAKTQAFCVQVQASTFELLYELSSALLQTLQRPLADIDQQANDAIYHALICLLRILAVNLAMLAPPPVHVESAAVGIVGADFTSIAAAIAPPVAAISKP